LKQLEALKMKIKKGGIMDKRIYTTKNNFNVRVGKDISSEINSQLAKNKGLIMAVEPSVINGKRGFDVKLYYDKYQVCKKIK
jgi:hypothetical protein